MVNDNIEKRIFENLGLHTEILEKLKGTMSLKKFKKKDVLINGEYGRDKFFIVKSGVARSYSTGIKSKEFIKTLFVHGMAMASIRSVVRDSSSALIYDCLTDCEFYVGDYNVLRSLAEKDHQVAINYFKLLEVVFLDAEDRVFELTLNAEAKYKLLKERIPYIENLIPQYQIASYLNITNVQLSRVRKKLLFTP